MEKIKLNIGGRLHTTTTQTLSKYPDTLLYRVISNKDLKTKEEDGSYFFDRNPDLFSYVLDFYRNGKVVYPTFISKPDFLEEMKFWGIILDKDEKEEVEIPTLDDIVNFNLIIIRLLSYINDSNRGEVAYTICDIIICIKESLSSKKRQGHAIIIKEKIENLSQFFNFKAITEYNAPAVYDANKNVWMVKYGTWESNLPNRSGYIIKIDGKDYVRAINYTLY